MSEFEQTRHTVEKRFVKSTNYKGEQVYGLVIDTVNGSPTVSMEYCSQTSSMYLHGRDIIEHVIEDLKGVLRLLDED